MEHFEARICSNPGILIRGRNEKRTSGVEELTTDSSPDLFDLLEGVTDILTWNAVPITICPCVTAAPKLNGFYAV